MPAAAPQFRDLARLTSWVRLLLYVNAAVAAAWIVSDAMQLQLLASAPYSLEDAEANATRQQIVIAVYFLSFVATVVPFAVWVYRANVNVRQLGAQDLKFTPGWAVAWYFVPFLSFWKPYQAMKEIWRASKSPGAWEAEEIPVLLSWWWCAWIVASIGGNLSFKFSLAARTVDDLVASTWVSIAVSAVTVASAVLAAKVIGQIHSMQIGHTVPAGQ
jgi:hypothetical protein